MLVNAVGIYYLFNATHVFKYEFTHIICVYFLNIIYYCVGYTILQLLLLNIFINFILYSYLSYTTVQLISVFTVCLRTIRIDILQHMCFLERWLN